jgi:hypothetical protein
MTPAVISDTEICRMQEVVGELRKAETSPSLRQGDRVRMRLNAIATIEGIVESVRQGRATVAFGMLGSDAAAIRDVAELELVG